MKFNIVNENGQKEVFDVPSDKSALLYASAIGLLLGGLAYFALHSFF